MALFIIVAAVVFHKMGNHYYLNRIPFDTWLMLIATFLSFATIIFTKPTSNFRLPYIIFIFCLVILAITTLPNMSCESQCNVDTDRVANAIDGLARAMLLSR